MNASLIACGLTASLTTYGFFYSDLLHWFYRSYCRCLLYDPLTTDASMSLTTDGNTFFIVTFFHWFYTDAPMSLTTGAFYRSSYEMPSIGLTTLYYYISVSFIHRVVNISFYVE